MKYLILGLVFSVVLSSCNSDNKKYSDNQIKELKRELSKVDRYMNQLQEVSNTIIDREVDATQRKRNGEVVVGSIVELMYDIDNPRYNTLGVIIDEDGPYRIVAIISYYSDEYVIYNAIVKVHFDDFTIASQDKYGFSFILVGDEKMLKYLGAVKYTRQ